MFRSRLNVLQDILTKLDLYFRNYSSVQCYFHDTIKVSTYYMILENQRLILNFFKWKSITEKKILSVQIVKIIQPLTILCKLNILTLKFGQAKLKEARLYIKYMFNIFTLGNHLSQSQYSR